MIISFIYIIVFNEKRCMQHIKGKEIFLLFIYLISCGSYRIHMLWDIFERFLHMIMINGILVWILLVIKGNDK